MQWNVKEDKWDCKERSGTCFQKGKILVTYQECNKDKRNGKISMYGVVLSARVQNSERGWEGVAVLCGTVLWLNSGASTLK